MDHNYRGRVSGVYDGTDLDDKYYYGRRPTGTYVPRFRNVLDDKQTDFLRGYALHLPAGVSGDGGTGRKGLGPISRSRSRNPAGGRSA